MSSRLEFRVRAFVAKLRGFLSKPTQQDEFHDEVREHLQMLTERFAAQGLSPEKAARAARLQFGNTTLLKEDRRELQSLTGVEALWLDFRYAMRTLWKSRAFAAVSIATLALGIGAATAIFGVIDNVLLAPFPYKGADRMVFPPNSRCAAERPTGSARLYRERGSGTRQQQSRIRWDHGGQRRPGSLQTC